MSKMIHDSKQCSSDVTYCLPVRALLDVVVASCHWTTFPTSSSGTQPLHPKVYTNGQKNRLVLVVVDAGLVAASLVTHVERALREARLSVSP